MRKWFILAFTLFLLVFSVFVSAEEKQATLVFENREIITFRAIVVGKNPEARADGALKRLQSLRGMVLYSPVQAETIPEGYIFRVNEELLFGIVKADLEEGVSLDAEAKAVQARLTEALRARAEQTSIPFLIRAVFLSIGGTILFLILLRLVFWLRKKLLASISSRTTTQARLIVFGYDLRNRALSLVQLLARLLLLASILFLLYAWVTFLLNRFPYTRPWGQASLGFFTRTIQSFSSSVVAAVPNLIKVAIILGLVRIITKLMREFFDGVAKGTVHMPGIYVETADATRRLIAAVIWLFGLVLAYPYLPGAQTEAFKGVSVFVGILFTLGSAGVVGHLMSGLVLVYSRALKKGDFVRVGEVEGIVTEVGPLSTKIVNLKKEEFTLPNTMMVSSVVKNYSRQSANGAAISTTVTIGYDAPWRQVHEMLISAALKTSGILPEPKPVVFQTALSDFYVEYQLIACLEDVMKRIPTLSLLHQNIQDAFNEQGVQIMSPHFEGQPENPVLVPKAKWFPNHS